MRKEKNILQSIEKEKKNPAVDRNLISLVFLLEQNRLQSTTSGCSAVRKFYDEQWNNSKPLGTVRGTYRRSVPFVVPSGASNWKHFN